MTTRIGFIMDPLASIHIYKDTTYAMMREAQRRNMDIHYMQLNDLYLKNCEPRAKTQRAHIDKGIHLTPGDDTSLDSFDVIMMRKDPPFDMEYVFATYILELAEEKGVLVLNKPQSLRDANEKMFTQWFPDLCPPSLLSRDSAPILSFLEQHQKIVLKPLDSMGGQSIFLVQQGDPNFNVMIEVLTEQGTKYVMAQKYIPEITQGDKRILLIDGEPVPYVLARIPPQHDFRGNLAKGAKGQGVALSERDYFICQQIAPTLKKKGLLFVGLDVIGDYLTEINVTSPTGIQELDKAFDLNISALLFDRIEAMITTC